MAPKENLKAGPVWDYNFALGNASFCSGGLTTGWMYDGCIPATLPTPEMWRRLLQDSVMANEIKCRYNYLRKTYLDTAYLNQYINRYAFDTLKNPITRHYNKWKIIGTNPGGFNAYIATSYPDEISRLKTWMQNRLIWMDQNLKGVCREALPTEAKIKTPLSSLCQPNYTQAVEKSQIFNRMPYNYTGLEK
ncbi:MAG: CotH kinase family protein [Saprospiraceae bacterium]|nr:CotH kinase family protein [Saprospiraceae bacterium]